MLIVISLLLNVSGKINGAGEVIVIVTGSFHCFDRAYCFDQFVHDFRFILADIN